jgi:hypothetical protein
MSTLSTLPDAVIVNPDAFVARRFQSSLIEGPLRFLAARRASRANGRKNPLMCLDCVQGRHTRCLRMICPCIHHDLRVMATIELMTRPGG